MRYLARTIAALALLALAAPALAHDPAEEMAHAAQRFLRSLDEDRTAKATFSFDSDKRQHWHFVPDKFIKPENKRLGLPIKEMTPTQRLFAHALVNAALSHKGYMQTTTIMVLEAILHDMENQNPIRDPELYYVCIYGKPSTTDTWGWRFEGHHLSINLTLVKGKHVAVTPSFFGSNPATVPAGPHKGLEALKAEQQLARKLVKSLDDGQRKQAIIADKAPRDIITGQDRKVNKGVFFPAKGIAFADLNKKQQQMLLELVNEYAGKYRDAILEQIDKRTPITADGKDMHFAWAGGLEPGEGHYYRIQTPTFLFEYDNTQNGANHVHAVWRQFDGDFGADLLRQHYDTSAHHREDATKTAAAKE